MNTDCISRQAVIDSLYDWSNHSMTDAETWHLRQVIGDIKSMPSVTPQEPIKKLEEQIKQLQNRCHALTQGQMCMFCPYDCENRTAAKREVEE